MSDKVPRPGEQHPEQWRRDLNPDALAGANYGHSGPHPEEDARTAYDDKDLHRALNRFRDDELKQIPVIPAGARLEQGATYIDLAEDEPREFTATGDMHAERGCCLVLKSAVDYTLWNRLIGVENPQRTATPR
jgi:hypothetical protein